MFSRAAVKFSALFGSHFVVAISFAGDFSAIAQEARAWRAQHEHEIISEFVDFVAMPNLAKDAPNILRNAEALRAMCEKRGLATELLTLEGAPPIVFAELTNPNAKKTIAFYAHYDGQPVDPGQWKSEPWKPVLRAAAGDDLDWRAARAFDPEWRLYGRSTGDDKAPIMAMLAALDVLREKGRKPNVNLRFVFEGEEEAGSPHLSAFLAKYPEKLRPDAWILCDGPMHQSRRMQLYFGARGTVGLDLTVYGPVRGLHDGHYGNWVTNPIVTLTHLLDSMRDESGRILIEGFYNDVQPPSAGELEALQKIPKVEADLRREFQIAETEGEGKSLNELLMAPALNLRGIEAGHVGAQASNTIPTEARASIDFRLVPNETPEKIRQLVERHLEAEGFTVVDQTPGEEVRLKEAKIVKLNWESGYPSARTPLDLPFSRELSRILTAAGHEPIQLPTMGGSIPIYLFQQPNETPVIGLPIANHDDNQHAADENIRLQNLWDAIEVFAALFSGLGEN